MACSAENHGILGLFALEYAFVALRLEAFHAMSMTIVTLRFPETAFAAYRFVAPHAR